MRIGKRRREKKGEEEKYREKRKESARRERETLREQEWKRKASFCYSTFEDVRSRLHVVPSLYWQIH